jgi:ABC-type multidrug transport system ATPase subunit
MTKRYGDKTVVDSIEFSVRPGVVLLLRRRDA